MTWTACGYTSKKLIRDKGKQFNKDHTQKLLTEDGTEWKPKVDTK